MSGQRRSIELDFVRGIAILLVMSYHALTVPTSLFLFRAIEIPGKRFGATGVDLFFVLSGFLVGGLLMKELARTRTVDVKRFIFRRGFKIWPPYFAYIAFHVIVRRFPLHTFLLANLLQVQNYVGTSLSHTWTLSLEEHFYLILALVMGYVAVRHWSPKRILVALVVVCFAVIVSRSITIYFGDLHGALYYTHNRLDSLLFGVILAGVSTFFPDMFESLVHRRLLLVAISLLLLFYLSTVHTGSIWKYSGAIINYLGYGAFMLLVLRHSGYLTQLWPYRAIARIGVYSYGIYLWHLSVRHPCYSLISHLPKLLQWPLLFVSQFLTAILLGILMTHLVEWPFLRLREKMFPDKAQKVSTTEPAVLKHPMSESLVTADR